MQVVVREAIRADAGAVARVQVASWRAAYRGIVPDDFLDGMDEGERERRWQAGIADRPGGQITYLAELGGAGLGFAAVGECRDPDSVDALGELYAIYVIPEYWRRGVGRALHVACLDGLSWGGYERAALWVLRANRQARSFYEDLGWSSDRVEESHAFGERDLPIVRYGRRV